MTIPVSVTYLCRFSQCAFKAEAGILITPDCCFVEVKYSETDTIKIDLVEAKTQNFVDHECCHSAVTALWGDEDPGQRCLIGIAAMS